MEKRRSRMHRSRTGKHLALTSRDVEIFQTLVRYRYLRSTYLHAFCGGASETRFKERLGDLFHEGYIDRPDTQWEFAAARTSPVVYELDAGGRHVLDGLGAYNREERTFLGQRAHRQFAHAVMICECLASIELGSRERAGLRFIPWPEILAKAPENTRRLDAPFRLPSARGDIVPDGMFGLEYQTEGRPTYRFFALEADRATMPVTRSGKGQTSLAGKLVAYGDFIGTLGPRNTLGVPNLLVLIATTDELRTTAALKFLEPFPWLLVKTARPLERPVSALLDEPWQRIGHPPLGIAEAH